MATTERAALGQRFPIGTFYCARNDRFLTDSLLKPNIPADAVQTTHVHKPRVSFSDQDTYQKQFADMGISPALGASILGEMVNPRGATRHLMQNRKGRAVQAALYHSVTTVTEQLNFQCAGMRDLLATETIQDGRVSHFVFGIAWGVNSIVAARLHVDDSTLEAEAIKSQLLSDFAKAHFQTDFAKNQLQTEFATFASAIEAVQTMPLHANGGTPRLQTQLQTEVTLFSDMLEEDDGILLDGFQEALEYIQLMPLHLKDERGSKGWPISYALLPVEMLAFTLGVQTLGARPTITPAPDCLNAFVKLFDDYRACRRLLDDDQLKITANKKYLPRDVQNSITDRQRSLEIAVQRLKKDYANTLESVRGGLTDPGTLWNLLAQYQKGDLSPAQLGNMGASGIETAEFINTVVKKGAIYVGHNGTTLGDVLQDNTHEEAYVMYFSPTAMKNDASWQANYDVLLEILLSRDSKILVAIVDCEATRDPLDKVHISQIQNGEEISEDVLEDRKFMADKCFASCPEQTVEIENIQPPIQRRHVTIPCPGKKCSVAKVREWLCPRCRAPVEYGYSDQYIYCGCGRSLYKNYEFKCSNELHGHGYVPYDPDHLLRLLNGLIQLNYLNILILGETGVGKSTFINAMVNYLEFETLDEAIAAEKLNYVIPCAFSTQIMDRDNPDKPIEEKRVQVGSRDDEKDGSNGDSATQVTTVYPVTFQSDDSTLTVRLIDTPGIGDSRGVDYDRKNMADILSTISGYDMIHGILILLKSNNARLTITFRYCIKELLTHLHHNAAKNMAFGFTNTRISNYTPGDTYGPLKSLLGQHPDMGLKLETPSTYCFDSESFRYLAAYKSGTEMPNKLDFDRSWNQSREETVRLIGHYQSIPPHEVKNTMSLNGARQLISELTKPLAEITQIINTNIKVVEDFMQDLKDSRFRGDQLRNSLHVQKIQLNVVNLDRPRTVCTDNTCLEVRDDGKGQNNMVIIYKSHCHPVCYLDDVRADVVADPGLIKCAAFSGNMNCQVCGHHWRQHLHSLFELVEETVTVIDNGIQQQLNNHADDITLKQTAIASNERLVKEYRQEQEIIRNTAAKFCVFLKNNSLVPYNDALIGYLDFLIKEEQAKVQAGGNNRRLLSLTEERHKHQEAIDIITRHMNSNANWNDLSEGGVDRMVQTLYNLKHFGENLQNLKRGVTSAHQATYRERPYMVKRRTQGKKIVQVVQRRPSYAPRPQGPRHPQQYVQRRPSHRMSQHGHVPARPAQGGKLQTLKRMFALEY